MVHPILELAASIILQIFWTPWNRLESALSLSRQMHRQLRDVGSDINSPNKAMSINELHAGLPGSSFPEKKSGTCLKPG